MYLSVWFLSGTSEQSTPLPSVALKLTYLLTSAAAISKVQNCPCISFIFTCSFSESCCTHRHLFSCNHLQSSELSLCSPSPAALLEVGPLPFVKLQLSTKFTSSFYETCSAAAIFKVQNCQWIHHITHLPAASMKKVSAYHHSVQLESSDCPCVHLGSPLVTVEPPTARCSAATIYKVQIYKPANETLNYLCLLSWKLRNTWAWSTSLVDHSGTHQFHSKFIR